MGDVIRAGEVLPPLWVCIDCGAVYVNQENAKLAGYLPFCDKRCLKRWKKRPEQVGLTAVELAHKLGFTVDALETKASLKDP